MGHCPESHCLDSVSMKLTADLIEGFSAMFLSPRYDDPKPTPAFHRQAWGIYCSEHPNVALAAPRDHAKSTALTHDFILASVLFRQDPYVILVSSSEEMAIEHLQDISNELHENEDLVREFGIKSFLTDQKTDIVVECSDGYRFRIVARGAEQRIRGRKWNGRRPGLIVADDMEDDEQVESRERRRKFARWFFRAAKQALRQGGRIRVHGTVLHEDSLLANLLKDPNWHTFRFKAHEAFDDFSNILWPEKWPESALRRRRAEFVAQVDAGGYSAEFLNDPLDNDDRFFRVQDFLPLPADFEAATLNCAAADFAVSKADKADRTALLVGGKSEDNRLNMLDMRLGRWDAFEIIEEMFSLQARWNLAVFFVESGPIWSALAPMVYREMEKRDVWINLQPVASVKDKATRARSFQRRMRAGGVLFDKSADWFPAYQDELMRFTGYARDAKDDQVDASSLLSRGFDMLHELDAQDFQTPQQQEEAREFAQPWLGQSAITGY